VITVSRRDPRHLTIREIMDVHAMEPPDRSSIERVLSVKALAQSWQRHFERLLHD
jgi:MOSC domain-containing protein YiiM